MLALVLIAMSHFSETAAQIHFRGEVGGNVTIHCPFDRQRRITFFYFQNGTDFVNGYHTTKDISGIKTWENTRIDPKDKTTVHMHKLNTSHSGDYECLIHYSDNDDVAKTVITLSVTANYSKPEVTELCSDGFSCLVTCASHGGYPASIMAWDVPVSQMWKVVNESKRRDPNTMLVNISSSAYFNCSSGELRFLSCSVGDVTSDMFSVCTRIKDPPGTYNPHLIAAVICAVLVFIIVVLLLWWKYKKGQTRPAADVRHQQGVNGYEGTVAFLNENKGEEESP